VVEKILATRMMHEAEERGLIPWNQMGARKHRSTLSALELLSGSDLIGLDCLGLELDWSD
jgi:hypothetical protein